MEDTNLIMVMYVIWWWGGSEVYQKIKIVIEIKCWVPMNFSKVDLNIQTDLLMRQKNVLIDKSMSSVMYLATRKG